MAAAAAAAAAECDSIGSIGRPMYGLRARLLLQWRRALSATAPYGTCSSTTLKHLTMKSYVVRGHRSSPADKLLTADVHVGLHYNIQLDFFT